MLNAADNESVMSQASNYCRFGRGRKSVELIRGHCAPMTVLTEQSVNTGTTMILHDPHLTARQLALLLGILIGNMHTLLSTKLCLSHACAQWIPHLLSSQQKKCSGWSVPISDRTGSQRCKLFEYIIGSFQFAAKDHKKNTVCGHDGRPDSCREKNEQKEDCSWSVARMANLIEYTPNKVV